MEVRKTLARTVQEEINNVIEGLTEDPNMYADRTTPISRDGRTFVYNHPEPAFQITYEVDQSESTIYFLHFAEIKIRFPQ